MRSLFTKFLLLAALGAATWLIVLWRWYVMQRVVSVEDVVLYLLALPLGLFAFVLAMRWAVLRGAASAQAAAEAAATARTAGQTPAAQPVAPPAWPLLGAWVNTPAGADLEALRAALAEGAPRPAPDARLRDQDGLPLLSARIPALDVPAIEAALAATTGTPPVNVSPAVLRALAALAPLIDQAAEPWCQATDAAAPKPAAPRLQVLVHWPAAWSAAESEAAQAWLKARLQVLAADAQPSRPWALRSVADGGVALLREAIGHVEAVRAENQDGLVLALACHSDLDDAAVQRLEREQRLYAFARRPRGVMPGEAAAALLLSAQAPSAAVAPDAPGVALRGFQAACSEADRVQLQALLSQSLAASGLEAARVTALVGDAPQHVDAAMALYALAQASLAHLDAGTDVRLMGTLCGHTGAVAPLLALAAAWGECAHSGQSALAVSLMGAPWRMVAALVPESAAP
ncbi:hypothetical protein [Azohydromonas australica]|uniref:hypothetical protein n=1 Tax=Azohydromonas australica TaxID=364039 RepID=UPI00042A360B|nr:hypothetical protein [Azohydromonas australica]